MSNHLYNRQIFLCVKKKGKKQIVIGLLTGLDGIPVATKTVAEQVRILVGNFGVKDVTFVVDRGMLKGPQVASKYFRKLQQMQPLRKNSNLIENANN